MKLELAFRKKKKSKIMLLPLSKVFLPFFPSTRCQMVASYFSEEQIDKGYGKLNMGKLPCKLKWKLINCLL